MRFLVLGAALVAIIIVCIRDIRIIIKGKEDKQW